MLVAGIAAIDREGLDELLAGAFRIALGVQQKMSVLHQNVGGFDRRPGRAALRQGDGLLEVAFGGDQQTGVRQRARQVGQRGRKIRLVERARIAANGDGLLEQGYGTLVQSLAPVGKPNALEQLRAHFRVQSGIARDLVGAAIKQVLGGGLAALGVERIRLRENVDQERRYLLRAVALLGGCVARQRNAVVLPQRDAGDGHQSEKYRRRSDYREQVSAQELGGVVAPIALPRP